MFLQQLVNGLTLGAVYALIAVGYTMVYGIIELINFAHGEIYMFGAFLTMTFFRLMGMPLLPAAFLGIALTILLGVLVEYVAYRPLRNSSRLTALVSALGMSIVLQNAAMLLWGAKKQPFRDASAPSFFEELHVLALPGLGSASIANSQIFIFFAAGALMFGLSAFVNGTRMGRAMRCCAQDKTAARLMGINVNRTISFTFALGSGLAAIAGILNSIHFNQVFPVMGFIAGLKAFTAAVLGGIGNIRGAYLGGLLLGLVEGFAAGYIDSLWTDAIAFLVLIVVITLRPSGLLGEALPDRA